MPFVTVPAGHASQGPITNPSKCSLGCRQRLALTQCVCPVCVDGVRRDPTGRRCASSDQAPGGCLLGKHGMLATPCIGLALDYHTLGSHPSW